MVRLDYLNMTLNGRFVCANEAMLLCQRLLLVPDDTVHKGTSKHHKTYEQSTNFALHISPSIFGFKKNQPTAPTSFQNVVGYFSFHMLIISWVMCTAVFSVVFGFVPNPQNIYPLIKLTYFRLLLIQTENPCYSAIRINYVHAIEQVLMLFKKWLYHT